MIPVAEVLSAKVGVKVLRVNDERLMEFNVSLSIYAHGRRKIELKLLLEKALRIHAPNVWYQAISCQQIAVESMLQGLSWRGSRNNVG